MNSMNKDYWGRFSNDYDEKQEAVVGSDLLQIMIGQLKELPHLGDVVEFGCGTGVFSESIVRKANHLVATDLSGKLLERCRSRFEDDVRVTVEETDCMGTPFPSNHFDTVVMANLLHVIGSPLEALRESRRVLKSGGRVVILSFTNVGMKGMDKLKLGIRYLRYWGKPPKHVHVFSLENLGALLKTAGFEVESAKLLGEKTKAVYVIGKKA